VVATCYPVFGFSLDSGCNVKKQERREKIESTARQNLLGSAERWLNVRELSGNNDHPMITKAMKLCGLSGKKGYPWCAACQSEIFYHADISAPHSARVVDWFKSNIIWKREWGDNPHSAKAGMMAGLYYQRLGRYGHIGMIIAEDNNNYYLLEGNTNIAGSREGDGFYRKIRSKKSVAVISDKVLKGNDFDQRYYNYLKTVL